MNRFLTIVIATSILAAGCAKPLAPEEETAKDDTAEIYSIYWRDRYAVVHEWNGTMNVQAHPWESESVGPDYSGEVVIVDAQGIRHVQKLLFEDLVEGEAESRLLARPDGPLPMLVYASCGCQRLNLEVEPEGNNVSWGNSSLVIEHKVNVTVDWWPGRPTTVTGQAPARMSTEFDLPPGLMFFKYSWGGTLDGKANITAPSGEVIAAWTFGPEGDQFDAGTFAHPLEPGTWQLHALSEPAQYLPRKEPEAMFRTWLYRLSG